MVELLITTLRVRQDVRDYSGRLALHYGKARDEEAVTPNPTTPMRADKRSSRKLAGAFPGCCRTAPAWRGPRGSPGRKRRSWGAPATARRGAAGSPQGEGAGRWGGRRRRRRRPRAAPLGLGRRPRGGGGGRRRAVGAGGGGASQRSGPAVSQTRTQVVQVTAPPPTPPRATRRKSLNRGSLPCGLGGGGGSDADATFSVGPRQWRSSEELARVLHQRPPTPHDGPHVDTPRGGVRVASRRVGGFGASGGRGGRGGRCGKRDGPGRLSPSRPCASQY
uniref:Translation initiation factor IF-2-like n=1 Tax=Petromyzon marinus TaxID=7757 RepID=A0AAJ7UE12_PETMA|nr:translation initiation factor IF-2-like [Petromyzon marinus]